MFFVKNTVKNEIIIKNSRFIAYLYPINSIDEINENITEIKKEHPKANHITYAYILNNTKKAYDDKEPTGTAGNPILNVLEKNNLMNTLCIVVRYFGGIKLGAGGLIRAYGKSARNTLENATLLELEKAKMIELKIKYDELNKIIYLLDNPKIIEKSFNELITLKLITKEDNLNILEKNNYQYKILEDCYIEKTN